MSDVRIRQEQYTLQQICLLRNQGKARLWDCGDEQGWMIRDRRLL